MNTPDELAGSMRAAVTRLRAAFPKDTLVQVSGHAISCGASTTLKFLASVDDSLNKGEGRTPSEAVDEAIARADPKAQATLKLAEAARLTEEARILNEGAASQRQAQASA